MSRRRTLLFVAGAVLVLLLCATATFLLVPEHWFQAAVGEPTTEEYAVYSGFIDNIFDSQHFHGPKISDPSTAVIYVAAETLPSRNPGSILPLQVVALGTEQMGRDFYRQNARSWKLQPAIHARYELRILPKSLLKPYGPAPYDDPKHHQTCTVGDDDRSHGALHLSRVGFSRDHKLALLEYEYVCNRFVGSQSGWILMENANGSWKVKSAAGGYIS